MSHNFVPESILTISFSSVQVKKQIYSNITCAHGNGGCAIGMTVIRFPLIKESAMFLYSFVYT